MRRPRLDPAGYPVHFVQRGVDRRHVFSDDEDRQHFLIDLATCASRAGVAIHAYVLMDNHVHLLATPSEAGAVSAMACSLGARFVARFNRRHDRTGTLWERRFYSCVVESDRYLLACQAYIERNPVRAGMVAEAVSWPWSSAQHNTGRRTDALVKEHPVFVGLGSGGGHRHDAWRRILGEPENEELLDDLRTHTRWQGAWGSDAFRVSLEQASGRPLSPRPRGRPRNPA